MTATISISAVRELNSQSAETHMPSSGNQRDGRSGLTNRQLLDRAAGQPSIDFVVPLVQQHL